MANFHTIAVAFVVLLAFANADVLKMEAKLEANIVARMEAMFEAREKSANNRIKQQDELIDILQQRQTNFEERIQQQHQLIENLQHQVEKLLLDAQLQTKTNIRIADRENNNNKVLGARSCEEIRSIDPTATSGVYFVDPDGWSSGDAPISVYCDMSAGWTSVRHDSETTIQATQCLDPGCYSRPVNYNATMRQMVALSQISNSCRQSIQFDCNNVPLEFNSVPQAWWNDRNGRYRYYWAGSFNNNTHACQCGLDGSCVLPSVACNCDASASLPLSDAGYITNKNELPVTQLNFGRTIVNATSGNHTLGLFQCSGRASLDGMPASCDDLWRIGHDLNGFYTIKGTNRLQSVYCDFSKVPGDQGIQSLIGSFDVKSSQVFFYAQAPAYNVVGTVIPFPTIKYNIGGGFNANGTFTAPVSGTYFFSYNGLNNANTGLGHVYLFLNGLDQDIHGWASENSVRETMTLDTTLNLIEGDQVELQLAGGELDASVHNTFNGFLLEEDLSL